MGLPKLILTDIDGVWTDGGMYYGPDGSEYKKFNTKDSAGVLFCKVLDIPIGILTGENSDMVIRRAEKLKIDYCFINVKDKLYQAKNLINGLNIDFKEVAYIGDDINDLNLLKVVGFSATVADAPSYIKDACNFITNLKGGEGAFREFVEYIIKINNINIENIIQRIY